MKKSVLRMSWTLLELIFLLWARSAECCETLSIVNPPAMNMLELAGCSTLPDQYELHMAFQGRDPIAPWDGAKFWTYWERDGNGPVPKMENPKHYFFLLWQQGIPKEIDECGEPTFHGRGSEAQKDIRCDEIWLGAMLPYCNTPASTGCVDLPHGYVQDFRVHAYVKLSPDADVDGDNVVGGSDLRWVARAFGDPALTCPTCDVNGDGTIGAADLIAVRRQWGKRLASYTVLGHRQRYYTTSIPWQNWGTPKTHVWTQRTGG